MSGAQATVVFLAAAAAVRWAGVWLARVQRLEPDPILLLIAYAGALFAVWSVRP